MFNVYKKAGVRAKAQIRRFSKEKIIVFLRKKAIFLFFVLLHVDWGGGGGANMHPGYGGLR
jgi:hypothetical protein